MTNALTKKTAIAALTLLLASAVASADPIPYDGQTADGDYTISTATQLSQLANNLPSGGFSGSTFTLQNDIDASAELSAWGRPIGVVKGFDFWSNPAVPFRGTFDGCGHIIRNLNVSCTKSSGWGLFGNVAGADIRNLTVEGTMSGSSCSTAGLLVGKVDADTTISNCTVRAEVAGCSAEVGAIIGCVSGANC